MIVTKALAEKYLIKKHCYLIEPEEGGGYRLVSTSVHWKEGMEVFETQEECLEEINRRLKIKMNAGNCPRCEYKSLIQTERDITKLELLQKSKSGALYRCAVCGTVWYKENSLPKAIAYDAGIADYIVEWAERDLKPDKEMEVVLHQIKDISSDKSYQLFPAKITLKNGFELPYALIKLERHPPPVRWFAQSDWFYLDQVAKIEPSPYAYPYAIAKNVLLHSNVFIHIKDIEDGQLYSFDATAGIFMPEELAGKKFQFTGAGYMKPDSKIIMQQDINERGGPDQWSLTPPPKPTWIWGDL